MKMCSGMWCGFCEDGGRGCTCHKYKYKFLEHPHSIRPGRLPNPNPVNFTLFLFSQIVSSMITLDVSVDSSVGPMTPKHALHAVFQNIEEASAVGEPSQVERLHESPHALPRHSDLSSFCRLDFALRPQPTRALERCARLETH